MLPVVAWKIYCSDGKVYTTAPDQIPRDVQVVIYYHEPPYRTIDCGEDTYTVDGITVFGKWMDTEGFERLLLQAATDHQIP